MARILGPMMIVTFACLSNAIGDIVELDPQTLIDTSDVIAVAELVAPPVIRYDGSDKRDIDMVFYKFKLSRIIKGTPPTDLTMIIVDEYTAESPTLIWEAEYVIFVKMDNVKHVLRPTNSYLSFILIQTDYIEFYHSFTNHWEMRVSHINDELEKRGYETIKVDISLKQWVVYSKHWYVLITLLICSVAANLITIVRHLIRWKHNCARTRASRKLEQNGEPTT